MIKQFMYAAAFVAMTAQCVACGGSSGAKEAATTDSLQTATNNDEPYADNDRDYTQTARLGGHDYSVRIRRTADKELPVVTDELGKKFYDNRVEVSIMRDGKQFFNRSYTKDAFREFLSDEEQKGTVLLGMAFDADRSDGKTIRLGAQVGQTGIEEGPAFCVEIPLDGSASSIVRDKNQDTTGDDGLSD